ncbi:hypothetical protein HS088_TW23G00032 [Tripterygium wilfordii]|uniref:B-like cyclin n=2 Tax=Tripterygium wilfordii TaxID=458696 RepID=A0A7J7BTI3_TRIWF|nr:hypothetical protein HS088_TW23G00032 [Tripterygium wilfordii]
MSTQNRRSSFSSSTSSSLAKRNASSSENLGKVTAVAKKRAPLTNLTNLKNFPSHGSRSLGPSATMVPCSTKIGKSKKGSPIPTGGASFSGNALPLSSNTKTSSVGPIRATPLLRSHDLVPSFPAVSASCSMDVSPSRSDENSVSMDETISTCDSFKSPEIEYVDNNDPSAIESVDRKTFGNLNLSDHAKTADDICGRDTLADMETDDKIVNVDNNYTDPQLCATIACDIYNHLRATEVNKRPSTDFMERIQTDINANMRSILVDWLVEVAEEYRLVPDTLYLTVNYLDRYLSGNVMNRQRLQLLGVACMMIAA